MLLEFLSTAIYLPLIAFTIVICQTHFKKQYDDQRKGSISSVYIGGVILTSYILQMLVMVQIGDLSMRDAPFATTIPVTMVLHQPRSYWWKLMAITPFAIYTFSYFNHIINLKTWALWPVATVGLFVICWLAKLDKKNSFLTYSLAIIATMIFHVICLYIGTGGKLDLVHLTALLPGTGLLNYRAFNQEIGVLPQQADIHTIIIGALDIDHFKRINDTYGHLNGNDVLSEFSETVKYEIHHAFPKHGYIYRFGGEEFTIVVSNHSMQEVRQLMEKIETHFHEHMISTRDGYKVNISFSCSLTPHKKGELLVTTLKRADRLLYHVKNNGRGWVMVSH